MLLPFSKSTVRPLLILDRSLAGGWVAGAREEFFGPDRFGRLDRQVPTVQDFHFRSDDAIAILRIPGGRIDCRIDATPLDDVADEQLGLGDIFGRIEEIDTDRTEQAEQRQEQDLALMLEQRAQDTAEAERRRRRLGDFWHG